MCNHPLIAHGSHGADFGCFHHFPMISMKNPINVAFS